LALFGMVESAYFFACLRVASRTGWLGRAAAPTVRAAEKRLLRVGFRSPCHLTCGGMNTDITQENLAITAGIICG